MNRLDFRIGTAPVQRACWQRRQAHVSRGGDRLSTLVKTPADLEMGVGEHDLPRRDDGACCADLFGIANSYSYKCILWSETLRGRNATRQTYPLKRRRRDTGGAADSYALSLRSA